MIKKIIAGTLIAGLAAGSVCGIYYGVKYNKVINEDTHTKVEQTDVNGLKNNITELKAQLQESIAKNNELQLQVNNLTSDNESLNSQILSLKDLKTENENTIQTLNASISANNATITELNNSIAELRIQVAELEQSEEDKSAEIQVLNGQISNLQALSSQLQTTNEINVNTITSLNSQITQLNVQIVNLTNQVNTNNSSLNTYQTKISELEKSIAFYELYIANLESDTNVVATFIFNGSVIGINQLEKGSTTSIKTPESTERVTFNYWMVNGEQVDLATYPINSNTEFVANVTIKHLVTFASNGENVSSAYYEEDDSIALPENLTRTGYDFDGWTINNIDVVDPTTYTPSEDITFIAKWTKVHTVTYIVEDQTYTEPVRNGEYAEGIDNTTLGLADNIFFNGWYIGENLVSLKTYPILSDTVLTADLVLRKGLDNNYTTLNLTEIGVETPTVITSTKTTYIVGNNYIVLNRTHSQLSFYNKETWKLESTINHNCLFYYVESFFEDGVSYGTSTGFTYNDTYYNYGLVSIDFNNKTVNVLYASTSEKFTKTNYGAKMTKANNKLYLFTSFSSSSDGDVGKYLIYDFATETATYKSLGVSGGISSFIKDNNNLYLYYYKYDYYSGNSTYIIIYNTITDSFIKCNTTSITTLSLNIMEYSINDSNYNFILSNNTNNIGLTIDSSGNASENTSLLNNYTIPEFSVGSSGIILGEDDEFVYYTNSSRNDFLSKYDKINKTISSVSPTDNMTPRIDNGTCYEYVNDSTIRIYASNRFSYNELLIFTLYI